VRWCGLSRPVHHQHDLRPVGGSATTPTAGGQLVSLSPGRAGPPSLPLPRLTGTSDAEGEGHYTSSHPWIKPSPRGPGAFREPSPLDKALSQRAMGISRALTPTSLPEGEGLS